MGGSVLRTRSSFCNGFGVMDASSYLDIYHHFVRVIFFITTNGKDLGKVKTLEWWKAASGWKGFRDER